jgi:glycosyl transferase family 87
VACFAATMRLLGVPLRWALGIAVALAITFPGAYGIGNPVPIIGLGIAVAYRYRDEPVVAGLGVALAAMPKSSGLLLAIPFLLAGRLRTVGYAVLFSAAAAVVPVALQPNIWSRYLTAGIKSVDANAYQRGDNASLLHLARSLWGLPYAVTVLLLAAVAIGMAIRQHDLFWPTAWACVAMLPISWMYSLLSLLPLIVFAVRQTPRRTVAPAALAIGVASGSPPLAEWADEDLPGRDRSGHGDLPAGPQPRSSVVAPTGRRAIPAASAQSNLGSRSLSGRSVAAGAILRSRWRLARPTDAPHHGVAGDPNRGGLGDWQVGQPQRPPGPAGQQPDRAGSQHRVRSPQQSGERSLQEQESGDVAGLGRAGQLRPVSGQPFGELRTGARRVDDAERFGDARRIEDVRIPLGGVEPTRAIALISPQEAVDFGDMNPAEQMRVGSVVRPAVGRHATNPLMNRPDAGDHIFRVSGGTERGDRQKRAGALQPAKRVAAVARVRGHPGHRDRM